MSLPTKAGICASFIQVPRNPLLHVRGASDAEVGAVQDLSIEVSKGQSLLVVGHSGCGKSSFLRAIAGESLVSSHAGETLSPFLPSMLSLLAGLALSLAFVPRLCLRGVQSLLPAANPRAQAREA